MSESAVKTDINALLRDMAETRLKAGTAGNAGNYSLGQDALDLLHRLSSDPDSASDALKLLHELQVHQVEIDLQNEAIQNDGHRLFDDLAHYRELYENAPAGYFLVDFDGKVLKVNQAGARLLGASRDELGRTHITRFIAADSQPVLTTILESLSQGDSGQAGEVFTTGADNRSRRLRVMANLSPDKQCALLICCDIS